MAFKLTCNSSRKNVSGTTILSPTCSTTYISDLCKDKSNNQILLGWPVYGQGFSPTSEAEAILAEILTVRRPLLCHRTTRLKSLRLKTLCVHGCNWLYQKQEDKRPKRGLVTALPRTDTTTMHRPAPHINWVAPSLSSLPTVALISISGQIWCSI
ncbi:hypothetical protein BDZ94DRAFT_934329 [Collybia nuda]|uniref:Uncharacterized protein n=1 Tax=Collybia nuda TaxID=64659 RepID=A0A9P6CGW0_9AGAR|nr:hypothetical protein BDZ94DRAFT_934329 [Collybia nuda]